MIEESQGSLVRTVTIILKYFTWSPFVLQAFALFLLIFVNEQSKVSIFKIDLGEYLGDFFMMFLFFYYIYPIAIGLIGAVFFGINFNDLSIRDESAELYLFISVINVFSFAWAYLLLLFVVIYITGFEWKTF